MKTTRVGGGHTAYGVLADPVEGGSMQTSEGSFDQQDLWHDTLARLADTCAASGIRALYGPEVKEVWFAQLILEAMPDGTGVATLDGKMQDDATWKQAKVMVDLARLRARKDPDLTRAYGFEGQA